MINRSVDTSSTLAPECRIPAEVLTPNLTPGGELASWSEDGFIKTLRTRITSYGRQLNNEMPWEYYGQMIGDELSALWMYLQALPALVQGG